MRDLTNRALDTAAHLGADYADVRVVRRMDESIAIKSGRVEGVAAGESEGFGVRVLVDGAWGFASSNRLTAAEADRVAGQAVRIAKASATALRDRVRLDDRPPAHGTYETPVEEDPFEVPLEQKIRLLLAADARGRPGQGRDVHRDPLRRPPRVEDVRRDRRQLHRADDHPRRRGRRGQRDRGRRAPAPELPRRRRRAVQGGRLRVRPRARPRGRAEALGEEAVALLSAPQCPSGRFTIILDPSQLYMQIHESCGHPSELDRVYGTEASYAGTSFLTTDKLDEGFRYGSDLVDIVADATAPGRAWARSAGTTRASRRASVPIVRDGHLRRLPLVAARPRRGSAASRAARCGPTAGTGSR